MAVFKILRGAGSRIGTDITPFRDGYVYFTSEDGGLYIDAKISDAEKRIRVNSPLDEQAITFVETQTLSPLNSGASTSSLFGKLAKAVSGLIDHLSADNPHAGAVPTNRKINSKQLTQDITLSAEDVGARAKTWMPSASEVGADEAGTATIVVSSHNTSGAAHSDIRNSLTKTDSALTSHTDDKSNPHGVTKSQVGLGSVPNVATNNQTPTYTEAAALAGLTSGEKLSVAFGKVAKAITDLIAHIGNKSNPHEVTATQVGAAVPSAYIAATLSGSKWSSNKQTVTVSGMASTTNGFVALSPSATAAQKTAAASAGLSVSAQAANSLTISAVKSPTVDIPIAVILLG